MKEKEEEKIVEMFRAELTIEELEHRTSVFQEFLRSIEITEDQTQKIMNFRFNDENF